MSLFPFCVLEMILEPHRRDAKNAEVTQRIDLSFTIYDSRFTIHDLRFTTLDFDKDPFPVQQPHQKEPQQDKRNCVSQRRTNRWCPRQKQIAKDPTLR